MRILPIASNILKKNSINFKADVVILPSTASDNQPKEDKFILERETEKAKSELQRHYPSKDDNLQIFLQPNGFRGFYDKYKYYNQINAYIGYRDSEKARKDIIQRDITPPNNDYIRLEKETIQKLINKEPDIMKKLQGQIDYMSEIYVKEDIPKIAPELVDSVNYAIKNTLDYGLTEWEKPVPKPLIIDSTADTFLPF